MLGFERRRVRIASAEGLCDFGGGGGGNRFGSIIGFDGAGLFSNIPWNLP
jgi:hypothetical protein